MNQHENYKGKDANLHQEDLELYNLGDREIEPENVGIENGIFQMHLVPPLRLKVYSKH